jgi:hypothetical protein
MQILRKRPSYIINSNFTIHIFFVSFRGTHLISYLLLPFLKKRQCLYTETTGMGRPKASTGLLLPSSLRWLGEAGMGEGKGTAAATAKHGCVHGA